MRDALGVRRTIISGGGSLAAHLDLFFEQAGMDLMNGYGLTETSPVVTCRTWVVGWGCMAVPGGGGHVMCVRRGWCTSSACVYPAAHGHPSLPSPPTRPWRASVRRAGDANIRGTIGHVIAHTEVRIVDPETHAPLEDGQQGLLLIRGPGVMQGWVGRSLRRRGRGRWARAVGRSVADAPCLNPKP